MKTKKIIELVHTLNYDMMDFFNDDDYQCFEYRTGGMVDLVMFMGYSIWDSDTDMREYRDNGEEEIFEPLDRYLRRKAKAKIERLNQFFKSYETN
jgi:hypothetical protein